MQTIDNLKDIQRVKFNLIQYHISRPQIERLFILNKKINPHLSTVEDDINWRLLGEETISFPYQALHNFFNKTCIMSITSRTSTPYISLISNHSHNSCKVTIQRMMPPIADNADEYIQIQIRDIQIIGY